jgi:hypothetical protein
MMLTSQKPAIHRPAGIPICTALRCGLCVCFAVGLASAGAALPAGGTEQQGSPVAPYDLATWLDEQFGRIWKEAGVEVSRVDDATFLRRAYLDLHGRIPSVAETRDFLKDESADKRQRLVDRLLVDAQKADWNTEQFAAQYARLWRRMMLPPGGNNAFLTQQFEPWLARQFRENIAYDQLARRLVTARGDDGARTAAFYAAVGGNPEGYATAFSRIFLGARLGCAQCHDHPFADWKQGDFWGLAAFFAGTTGNQPGGPGSGRIEEMRKSTISHKDVEYTAKFLWGGLAEIPDGKLPRDVLADWMTATDNPNFAAVAVNRVWQALNGRGLVAGVDDLDLAAPDERGPILDELAGRFKYASYDLRWLIRGICASRAYQAPSASPDTDDATLLAGHRPLKVLTSEQVFDSLEQALMLPITRSHSDSARHNGARMQMVSRLDESAGESPEEYSAGIPQVLMLMNGRITADAISLERSRTLKAVIEAPFLDESSKLDTLFLATLTRYPTEKERSFLLQHIRTQRNDQDRRAAFDEIFWALINSPEFVMCR